MPRIGSKLKIENQLQQLRHARNLTQEEVGRAVNVTRATIIAIEKGSYNPSLELAFRLSRYFKLGIEQIFFLKGNRHD